MLNGTDEFKMRNGYGVKMRNGMDLGIKCVILNFTKNFNYRLSFFSNLCFHRLSFFFAMECNIVVLIIHNISYTTISIKVVTETIVKCAILALKS
jgi:hypothetical protein